VKHNDIPSGFFEIIREAVQDYFIPPNLGKRSRAYSSESEHRQIVDEMRWYALNHPFAAAALEVRVSYVVGSGHNYNVVPKEGIDVPESDVERVSEYLREWMDADRWMIRQREIQYQLDRDGEVFLIFFETPTGLVVRTIDPEFVCAPPDAPWTDSFGVRVDAADPETPLGYWINRDAISPTSSLSKRAFEFIDAAKIQHRKSNVLRTEKRGVPILWPCRESLLRSYKILQSMSTVAAIQASVAAIVRRAAGSVAPFFQPNEPGAGKDAEGRTYQQLPPGSIVTLRPGEEWDAPANRIDVANFASAVQAELRAIAARLCLPEYMLSADASNANYSSSLVAEGPAVKIFERAQSEMIWYDIEILTRAVQYAEHLGLIPAGVSEKVRIEAEAPTPRSRDRLAEAQADQILLSAGVVSRETVAARHGFDWPLEKSRLEAEGGAVPTDLPQGLI